MEKLIKFIVSFFYLGYFPIMSGTIGSLGGLAVYFFVKANNMAYIFFMLLVFILGVLFSGKAEKIYNQKDSGKIVIDEVCGMLLSLFLVPYSIASVILGFFIFRVLDVLKPWPARSMEKLPGAYGVMLDDIAVAVYTNIILQIVFRVAVHMI